MALHAGYLSLGRKVWFVTLRTGRDVAVTIMVTAVTTLFAVFARELF